MYQEKYNINWHTYSDHLKEMLHEMMKSKELTDVTLVCDDKKQFNAHKVVLSACSSVFKSIIYNLPKDGSVIYLRGIKNEEMEAILQFMYLGKATFNQKRINEFLDIAKNLEIKEISDMVISEENTANAYEEEFTISNNYEATNEPNPIVDESKLSESYNMKLHACNQCKKSFKTKGELTIHIQSLHMGVRYPCNQCDYEAKDKSRLKIHTQSVHEGIKYECYLCGYQFTLKTHLKSHTKSVHEGIRYSCDQCDLQFTRPSRLSRHKKLKHKIDY